MNNPTPTLRRLLICIIFVSIYILSWDEQKLLQALRDVSLSDASLQVQHTVQEDSPSSIKIQNAPLVSSDQPIATVAYAISITKCISKSNPFDTAAVLKRSIELNSWPKHPTSRYAAKFYAFVKTANASKYHHRSDRCGEFLSLAGWTTIPKEESIHLDQIQEPPGSILKSEIEGDGCCGPLELIKLETFKLPHEIAVHLDIDTLMTNPFDELYNVMQFPPDTEDGQRARKELVKVVAPTYLNRRVRGHPSEGNVSASRAEELLSNVTVDAFYTKDYNMIRPHKGHHEHVGVQGGFLVVRTSQLTYQKLRDMVLSGEYYGGHNGKTGGWYKSGYGKHIWGSMTIQGLMGHYFDHVELEHSVELNRCRYNNIADNARISGFASNPKFPRGTLIAQARNESDPRYNYGDSACRDGRGNCDDVDCQRFPIEKTRMVHYTYCKQPKTCNDCNFLETYKEVACYAFIKEWFRVRSTITGEDVPEMKDDAFRTRIQLMREDGTVDVHQGNCYKEYTMGYCRGSGKYLPMTVKNMSLLPDYYIVNK